MTIFLGGRGFKTHLSQVIKCLFWRPSKEYKADAAVAPTNNMGLTKPPISPELKHREDSKNHPVESPSNCGAE